MPQGSKGSKIINLAEDVRTKRSVIQINNDDNFCCPRAIVTALTYHMDTILGVKLDKQKIHNIRIGRKLQKNLAFKLCEALGEYNKEGFTLEDIKRCELILNIQVKIVCAENFNQIIYSGTEKEIQI